MTTIHCIYCPRAIKINDGKNRSRNGVCHRCEKKHRLAQEERQAVEG